MSTQNAVAKKVVAPYEYEPSRLSPARQVPLHGTKARIRFRSTQPSLAVIDNLISPEECQQLIAQGEHRLLPSMVRKGAVDVVVDTYERSSYTHLWRRGETDLVAELDKRFCQLMGVPEDHAEGLSITRYLPGQLIRPHRDFFVPPHSQLEGGPRLATMVIYLNDDFEGGETTFERAGFTVEPKQGSAVYFEYGNSKGQRDKLTLHAGEPPRNGTKWIAVKIIRTYPFPDY